MPRIRYLKPEFFRDTRLARVSLSARYLYAGLWTLMDRRGICEYDPLLIKHEIFPYELSITPEQVNEWLSELARMERLIYFEAEGKGWLFSPHLAKHQKFHKKEQVRHLKHIDDVLFKQVVGNGVGRVPAPGEQGACRVLGRGEHPADTLQAALVIGNGELGIGNKDSLAHSEASPPPERPSFEVEALYEKYPRKTGRSRGLKRLKPQIKTQADYDAFLVAVDKYSKSSDVKKGFVKDFSTFVSEWKDWLREDAGKVGSKTNPKLVVIGPVISDDEISSKIRARARELGGA